MSAGTQLTFSFIIRVGFQAVERIPLTFRLGLPTSIHLELPHRHAQKIAPYVILDPFTLVIHVSHHREVWRGPREGLC